MIEKLQTIFKIPELKKKIIFTLFILFICRVGVHIPLPGIDVNALSYTFAQSQNALFGMFDMFTGGAFKKAAIFALGIMPYISASIIIQLLGTVFPTIAKMQKDEDGRKKITQYTRYGTVLLSAAQGYGVAIFLQSMNDSAGLMVVPNPGLFFQVMTMIILSTGTVIMMWLGEQITAKGIGQGISLIITLGIVARFPQAVLEEITQLQNNNREIIVELLLWVGMIGAISAVVVLTEGMRKLSVNYAKRQVAGRIQGGQASFLPLKINIAGVMPIIFAQSIMFVPTSLAQLLPEDSFARDLITEAFNYQSYSYMIIYVIVIVFFTYFYTAITFNTDDVSNSLKQSNGFIPGLKPGKDTSEYIDYVLTRITLPGSLFLAIIAIMPNIVMKIYPGVSYNLASFFGGTGLIIIVGVSLDTLSKIESYLMMHHYDGFLSTGKIQGRSV
ncbi:MAG: preprotein translocase subunit SecY [Candidatus Cloacimonadota bacterium]|nr:MAG: preprotein translocase subunit SecY [Candidatus Cloacimonadota bacterium]PIE79139.1 MAG: preprotein translocase subunit SecY [Candidatus Delongbacteria bacterium]